MRPDATAGGIKWKTRKKKFGFCAGVIGGASDTRVGSHDKITVAMANIGEKTLGLSDSGNFKDSEMRGNHAMKSLNIG